jgi:hypothetical protein
VVPTGVDTPASTASADGLDAFARAGEQAQSEGKEEASQAQEGGEAQEEGGTEAAGREAQARASREEEDGPQKEEVVGSVHFD